ncbi:unnamed protein product [Mytilus coruscus]|uniref:Uncharacterized protein n=1 Tax=Mytilus coruscus TaxID=42192 RepID=A0A6J8EWT8_MYTCO|nr:unnamed protein product [Mytilus coruscus]
MEVAIKNYIDPKDVLPYRVGDIKEQEEAKQTREDVKERKGRLKAMPPKKKKTDHVMLKQEKKTNVEDRYYNARDERLMFEFDANTAIRTPTWYYQNPVENAAYGSWESRHKRSSFVMAYWNAEDGQIVEDVGTGDLLPGIVQTYYLHNLIVENESDKIRLKKDVVPSVFTFRKETIVSPRKLRMNSRDHRDLVSKDHYIEGIENVIHYEIEIGSKSNVRPFDVADECDICKVAEDKDFQCELNTVYILQPKEEIELKSKIKQNSFTLHTVMALNVIESTIVQISSNQEFDLKPNCVYKIYMAERNTYGIVVKPKTKCSIRRVSFRSSDRPSGDVRRTTQKSVGVIPHPVQPWTINRYWKLPNTADNQKVQDPKRKKWRGKLHVQNISVTLQYI